MWRHIDVQADWRRSCTYGRAPNAIDISQGSLTCPSYTDTGPPFLYGDSDTPPHLVAFYDTLGIRRTYSRLKPRRPQGGKSALTALTEMEKKITKTTLESGWKIGRSGHWKHIFGIREKEYFRENHSFWKGLVSIFAKPLQYVPPREISLNVAISNQSNSISSSLCESVLHFWTCWNFSVCPVAPTRFLNCN